MFEEAGINVIRMGLQTTDEINENASVIAGPFHSSFGELVESSVYYDTMLKKLKGFKNDAVIYVNPSETSKAVGNKRRNIIKIKNELNINITVKGDSRLKKKEVRCDAT